MNYKPPITLSLNPSYYCNLRCSFCYLTETQLSDKTRLSLEVLDRRLYELSERFEIEHVDLYGGEVFMLPKSYLEKIKGQLQRYSSGSINVVTNLTTDHPFIDDPELYITVSYDGPAREQHERVFERMRSLNRPFSVLMLASEEFLAQDPLMVFLELSQIQNVRSVEIKPYSENQANQQGLGYEGFENWVREFIEIPLTRHYELVNETQIRDSLSRRRNAFSDDHIYLTPSGKWAVLEFDDSDCEFFLELNDLDEYLHWTRKERDRVTKGSYCGQCEFLGHCLTEHLRHVEHVDRSCNGLYKLLKWAKGEDRFKVEPIQTSPVKQNEPIWKKYMRAYHASTEDHTDELSRIRVLEKEPEWEDILEYLEYRRPRLIYPAKSIAVASIYAYELVNHYGGYIYDYLRDKDLFIGTDKYFTPYGVEYKLDLLYEKMIEYLSQAKDWRSKGWVPETLHYFNLECLP